MTRTNRLYLALLAVLFAVGAPFVTLGADEVAAVSADAALKRLQDGNERFAAGQVTHANTDAARRVETAKEGQRPVATVLGCADSRVPPERAFDQGVGDIFVVRVAGNVAGVDELGSMEYGVGQLQTPLLVVLGHTKCGAVKAVVERAEVMGHLKPLLALIAPAVERARQEAPKVEGDALEAAAIKENVWQSMADILTKSEEVRELVEVGKLKVVGGIYDLETGKVEWLGPHPEQERLMKAAAGQEPKAAEGKAAESPTGRTEVRK